MLTGIAYDDVCAAFPESDFNADGVYQPQFDAFLADHGYAVARKYPFRKHNIPVDPWPPEPFADVHYWLVTVAGSSPCHHFIVWLRDGRVLDPILGDGRKLSDYHRLLNVSGVIKIP
jgi:hypothetical protein